MYNTVLVDELEVVLEGAGADGALAHLQVGNREIVDVVDAHLVRYGKAAQRHVVPLAAVVPARRQ